MPEVMPMDRKYSLSEMAEMAEQEFPRAFNSLPTGDAIPWVSVNDDVDANAFYTTATFLGMVLDAKTGEYVDVLAYMDLDGHITISVQGTDMAPASLSVLERTMWYSPFVHVADEVSRSHGTLMKMKALAKFYFVDASYTTVFVDQDGTYWKTFQLACIKVDAALRKIENDQDMEKASDRPTNSDKERGSYKGDAETLSVEDAEMEETFKHAEKVPKEQAMGEGNSRRGGANKRPKSHHEVRTIPSSRSARPARLIEFSSTSPSPTLKRVPGTSSTPPRPPVKSS
jgi:hypothetical protein